MINKTTFHRIRKDRNFTIIDNEIIRRTDLSWKAKGILIYVFSLPNDWNINLKEIMTHATDGESAFRSGWKELTDLGYVKRKPIRDKETKKITHWITEVYENIDLKASNPLSENQDVANQDVANQDVANHNLLRTKGTKNLDILNTDDTKDPSAKAESNNLIKDSLNKRFEKLWKLYPVKKGKKKARASYERAIRDGATDKEIKEGIDNLLKEIESSRMDIEFVKHGSTWFNGANWEDELTVTEENTYGKDWDFFTS